MVLKVLQEPQAHRVMKDLKEIQVHKEPQVHKEEQVQEEHKVDKEI